MQLSQRELFAFLYIPFRNDITHLDLAFSQQRGVLHTNKKQLSRLLSQIIFENGKMREHLCVVLTGLQQLGEEQKGHQYRYTSHYQRHS